MEEIDVFKINDDDDDDDDDEQLIQYYLSPAGPVFWECWKAPNPAAAMLPPPPLLNAPDM